MAAWVKRTSRTSRIVSAVQAVPFEGLEGRLMLAGDVPWRINGDRGGAAVNDEIVIQVCETDGRKFEAVVNGTVVSRQWRSRVHQIIINGRNGHDDILIDLGVDNENVNVSVFGGSGNDTVQGGAEDDFFWGGYGKDSLDGGMGDDDLAGGGGNDLITGDEGDDYLAGGFGDDTMSGGMGDDIIVGQTGDDQIAGGWGEDSLSGGIDEDTLYGGDGVDRLNGGGDEAIDTIFREEIDYWKYSRFDITQEDVRVDPLVQVQDDTALKQWIVDSAIAQWQWAFGEAAYHWGWGGPVYRGGVYYTADASMNGLPLANGGETSGAGSHSNTNTQEANVDEADIVKADDEFLYVIDDNELVIIDAWPAEDTHEVARVDLAGWSMGMYLNGDRLTVLSDVWETGTINDGDLPTVDPIVVSDPTRLSIRPFWGGFWAKPQVKVTVYDIADRTTPTVLTETLMDGSLSSSRQLDSRAFLVLNNDVQAPRPKIILNPNREEVPVSLVNLAGQTFEVRIPQWDSQPNYVYESEESYRARLEAMSLDELMPQYKTIVHNADGTTTETTGTLAGTPNLYMRANELSNTMFTVALMDVAADAPTVDSTTSVVGVSGAVYTSQDSLYVTTQDWDTPIGRWQGDVQTNIYRFALEQDQAAYEGAGQVPGWVLNQFSMDEEGDYFRIATTSVNEGQSNNLFVLQDTGDTLDIVGGITEVAMTERIYSARFLGDRAFLVTFRQTDPLFTIDLSNPTEPTIQGVLEMPGYSAYLHPIDNDLLLGFGRDADLSGRIKGLQISLFNVQDMADPQIVDTYQFPRGSGDSWWWGSSDAEWDHHAFSYFAEYGILAIPVLDWGWWNGEAKLEILKVTPDGFESLGRIEHAGEVRRSARLGDYIYSIGTDAVKVVAINDPATIVTEVTMSGGMGHLYV